MACHDTLEFTDEELEAVIDETHRNGLYITAHATFDAAINRVTDFGIDCIEHGGPMTDATIEKVAKKNIFLNSIQWLYLEQLISVIMATQML